MQFTLISPTKSETLSITWLEVHTPQGDFVVQPGHVPMIVMLSNDRPIIIGMEDGSTTTLPVAGGILEINRTQVKLLVTHE